MASPRSISNADAGEGFDSEELFAAISTASVACGGHAGDDASMRAALELAKRAGVAAGAHPGYEDRADFGRRETGQPPASIGALVERQVGRLAEFAASEGVRLAHVKPHGALYHRATRDPEAARAIAAAVARLDPGLAILGWPGSHLLAAAEAEGLHAVAEAFVDRRYAPDGTLVPRGESNALLSPAEAIAQALTRAEGFPFHGSLGLGEALNRDSEQGSRVELGLKRKSLCLHSDSPGAAGLARAVRRALEGAGFVVQPFAPVERLPAIPHLHVVGAALIEDGHLLLTRRSARMSMAGKWEFPGGKVEAGEEPRAALAREVAEELGIAVEVGERIGRGTSLHAGRRIVLEVFAVRRHGGELRLVEHEEHGWFAAGEIATLDWPEADLPILDALAPKW